MSEWHETKAQILIDRQLLLISTAQAPSSELCEGMIQMAYALDLLNDDEQRELSDKAASAVTKRRRELREARNAALQVAQ